MMKMLIKLYLLSEYSTLGLLWSYLCHILMIKKYFNYFEMVLKDSFWELFPKVTLQMMIFILFLPCR